jgi:hypothetical protein
MEQVGDVIIVDVDNYILLEGTCQDLPEELHSVSDDGQAITITSNEENRGLIKKVLSALEVPNCADIPADFIQFITEGRLPNKYTLGSPGFPKRERATLERKRMKKSPPVDAAAVQDFVAKAKAVTLKPPPNIPALAFSTTPNPAFLIGPKKLALLATWNVGHKWSS